MIAGLIKPLYELILKRINIELAIPAAISSFFLTIEKYPLKEYVFFIIMWIIGTFIFMFIISGAFGVIDGLLRFFFPAIIALNRKLGGLFTKRIEVVPPNVRHTQVYMDKVHDYTKKYGFFLDWVLPVYFFLRYFGWPHWATILVAVIIFLIALCYQLIHYLSRHVNWNYQGKP